MELIVLAEKQAILTEPYVEEIKSDILFDDENLLKQIHSKLKQEDVFNSDCDCSGDCY